MQTDEYKVWYCDDDGDLEEWCAASASKKEAEHYAVMYGQDGVTKLVKVTREVIQK